jgi:hypothetical protein
MMVTIVMTATDYTSHIALLIEITVTGEPEQARAYNPYNPSAPFIVQSRPHRHNPQYRRGLIVVCTAAARITPTIKTVKIVIVSFPRLLLLSFP